MVAYVGESHSFKWRIGHFFGELREIVLRLGSLVAGDVWSTLRAFKRQERSMAE